MDLFHTIKLLAQTVCLAQFRMEHFAIAVQYHMDRLYCMIVPYFFFLFLIVMLETTIRAVPIV